MTELALRRCEHPSPRQVMPAPEVQAYLRDVPGWECRGSALEKRFTFADFHHTMAFVNALAWIAHAEDHHPDLQVSYGACTVRWSTHSAGGVSVNDFICAAKADALLE
jgi:4a-hydroxytetrahydrobiopterin dehydratase